MTHLHLLLEKAGRAQAMAQSTPWDHSTWALFQNACSPELISALCRVALQTEKLVDEIKSRKLPSIHERIEDEADDTARELRRLRLTT